MSEDSYTKTGNSIPISVDDMTNFVLTELQKYDLNPESYEKNSPYTTELIYTLPNATQVRVPEQIQIDAINMWTQYNKTHNNKEIIVAEENNETTSYTSMLMWASILAVILCAVYYWYNNK